MSDRWMMLALAISLAAIPVGLLGAGAFNPDDGWLHRSEPLWRVFGLYAYFGMVAGWLLGGILIVSLLRRRRRPRVTHL